MIVTHIFPGNLHFHSLDMVQTIVRHSKFDSRFVVYCDKDLEHKFIDLAMQLQLDSSRFCIVHTDGVLVRNRAHRNRFVRLFCGAATLIETLKIMVFSSRVIVSHCLQWQVHALLLAHIFGKKVFWVCWGDIPRLDYETSKVMQLYYQMKVRLSVWLYYRIITLMTSDKRTLENLFRIRHPVIVQPYPARGDIFSLKKSADAGRRVLLLGNSASLIMYYPDVLNRINIEEWDEVICMLNYGHENKQDEVDTFVNKYELKFGDKFKPWREVVPYEEYLSVLAKCSVYVSSCPRQIGLGAIYPMMAMGKKIYVNGANYCWLLDLGAIVFNLQAENMADTVRVCQPLGPEDRERNLSVLHDVLNLDVNMLRWDDLYAS